MTDRINRPTPIIDVLLPGRRVHLIGGASGSGKTTWLMQTIERWRTGQPIFGYASNPCPFVYLSYDRDEDDFIDTCERLKIDFSTYNFIAPQRSDFRMELLTYLGALLTKAPQTKLVIVEGIQIKTPEGKINDQRIVGSWLRELQVFCKERDITLIGTVHSPKTKERDRYKEPRARIAGCGAWAGYSSTVVIIEEKEADGDSALRELTILPRNARKHRFVLDFKDGLLAEVESSSPAKRFLSYLAALPLDQPHFSPNEAMEAIRCSRSLFNDRILKDALESGLIVKVDHGRYKRNSIIQ